MPCLSRTVIETLECPLPSQQRTAPPLLNRELSWLEFNRRVLHEAEERGHPLLERLKFVAIFDSNLDEFFMKRVGGLKQQLASNVRELGADGGARRASSSPRSTPWCAHDGRASGGCCNGELLPALASTGFEICTWAELRPSERRH